MSVSQFFRGRGARSSGMATGDNTAPTLEVVKEALRIDNDASDTQLAQNIAAAVALANRQAPSAPQAVWTEAVLRAVGMLYDAPQVADYEDTAVWRLSGAKALLSPWQVRRAGLIG